MLSEKAKASIEASCDVDEQQDLFALPSQACETSSKESDYETESDSPTKNWDIHSIDMESAHFRSLPADVRHEILTEMKETRKQSSWVRLHELPTESDDFAVFQMNRLRKRYQVQVSLEEAEKEMGGHSLSLAQLEQLLNDQGVITQNLEVGSRIASDENTRFLLIKDVKKAIDDARRKTVEAAASSTTKTIADLEFEDDMRRAIELSQKEKNAGSSDSAASTSKADDDSDLQMAIQLSLQCEPSTSSKIEDSFVSEDGANNVLTSAKNYMMEYSGLTPAEIAKIIGKQVKPKQTDSKNKTSEESSKQQQTSEGTKQVELQEQISSSTTTKDVEVMSDSDSDSSENLMEESNPSTSQSSGLEIVIKPTDALEDDLFGDIFGGKTESLTHKSDKISSEVVANPTSEDVESRSKPAVMLKTNENPTSEGFHDEGIVQSSSEGKKIDAVTIETAEKPPSDEIIVDSSTSEGVATNPTSEAQQSKTIAANLIEALSQPQPSTSKSRNEVIMEKQKTVEAIRQMLKSVKANESSEEITVSVDELKQVQANLSQEGKQLQAERATKERMAGTITDQMYQETQVSTWFGGGNTFSLLKQNKI